MIDGGFVIDAVTHAYNLDRSNYRAGKYAESLAQLIYGLHVGLSGDGYRVEEPQRFLKNWSVQELAHILFVESGIDLAVHHVLPLQTLYDDGLCSYEKSLEIRKLYPDRFLLYAGVDPLRGTAALDDLEQQVEALRPSGLKLYPAAWLGEAFKHTGWRMDDARIAFPLFERARKLGIKNIAVHKGLPMGSVPIEAYKVDDIGGAADAFPDLNFEIVHGGMAFLDETGMQLSLFPNVYVNLEVTGALIVKRERWFAEALTGLLKWAGPARIMWGSGTVFCHPQPALEKFWRDFQLPDDLVKVAGMQLTPEIKRMILCDNYARYAGVDIEAVKERIANDAFSKQRAQGNITPYSFKDGAHAQ
ncbi:amidohydrolase family protein [Hyalangium rubrum]|uniref:Amidohydrolase family protein n=1 Tax=Hyalangium rubrum TaxID=3103134 RepID=A0ABU5H7L3_9BACT|nr:amidohydrolase family protein [Hyalangium sp. s54d21]MDY7229246.1 amidohydrolase family protein [Hyalangium sp. s54d21]